MPDSQAVSLANVEIFKGLDKKYLQRLESVMRRRRYDAGQTILSEGDGAVGLFVILSGKAKVTKAAGEGQRELATMGSGEAFGEMALFRDNARRSATVTAEEPTECAVLHRLDFIDQIRDSPDIAIRLLDVMSRRLAARDEDVSG